MFASRREPRPPVGGDDDSMRAREVPKAPNERGVSSLRSMANSVAVCLRGLAQVC